MRYCEIIEADNPDQVETPEQQENRARRARSMGLPIEWLTPPRLHKNPTAQAIMNLLQKSGDGLLKGYYEDATKTLWLGDAMHYTHAHIAKSIGVPSNEGTWVTIGVEHSDSSDRRSATGKVGIAINRGFDPVKRTFDALSTSDPHSRLKQDTFFQLPSIARLKWGSGHSWQNRWE
jgi:hypothetical protein